MYKSPCTIFLFTYSKFAYGVVLFLVQVTEFYLHRMHEGEIYYVPTDWWIWVTSSDAFTISILLETNNASFFVNTVYNHSMVLVWTWVNPTQSSYLVRESVSQFQLTFRYILQLYRFFHE